MSAYVWLPRRIAGQTHKADYIAGYSDVSGNFYLSSNNGLVKFAYYRQSSLVNGVALSYTADSEIELHGEGSWQEFVTQSLTPATGGVYTLEGFPPLYPPMNLNSAIPIYDTVEEAIAAMSDGETRPITQEGVHVSFNPVELVHHEGVHVSFNPILTDPYADGGSSQPDGGGGQFDNPTDPIPLPDLPSIGVSDFIHLWNPSSSEMASLNEVLFTDSIITQAIRNIIGNPIQYVISLGIVPIPVSIGSIRQRLYLAHQDTGLDLYPVSSQYFRWSCGTVQVPLYWNSFLDFEPHSNVQIFLPFIGFREVSPSDVIGQTITVTYHIDVFSGSCVAFLSNERTILYQFNGSCMSPIPFSSEQMTGLVSGITGLLGSAATVAAVATGGFATGIGKMLIGGAVAGAASSVVSLPEHKAEHGGNMGSTAGLLASRKPYFVFMRPRQAVAANQGKVSGYATWYTVEQFSQLKGYTEIAETHLKNIPCTDWELSEIERLLKEGVIF